MNDYLLTPVAAILGIAAPLLISALKNCDWPDALKSLLALVVSMAFAGLAVFMTVGELISTEDYAQTTGIVFTVATVFYNTFFKETVWNDRLTSAIYGKIEPDRREPVGPVVTPPADRAE